MIDLRLKISQVFVLCSLIAVVISCKKETQEPEQVSPAAKIASMDKAIKVTPISHGTLVLQHGDMTIYVDPVGDKSAFEGLPAPNVILVTDIHGDHHSNETLEAVSNEATKIVVPIAVSEKLSDSLKSNQSILSNFQSKGFTVGNTSIEVEGIPMYNLREEAKQFHTKDRGNGYVVTMDGYRIYISGDTEDIPEMRQLKDIDMAFVCMNLPWTMPVNSAASAVLEFKPKVVYPYHYRGTDGLSDVSKFKELVLNGSDDITVRLENWYPNR